MTVESLAPVRARATARLLDQHLVPCPGCEKPAAVHLDAADVASGARPVLVRLVCPDGCAVPEQRVLDRLHTTPWEADAPLIA